MSKKQTPGKSLTRRQLLKYGLYSGLATGLPTSLWLNGCRKRPGRKELPNVIFISIDTLRADHLGCYGYGRQTSPFIDNLSTQAVRFENAYSETSWTLPAHMCMMTSQYPHIHGVETERQALRESAKTLAETLSKAGYHTSAFISWMYVSKKYGFDQGFDEFTELLPAQHLLDATSHWSYKAGQITDIVQSWLREKPKQPFFLFVHYFDPHIDYEPPEPYNRMFDPHYKGDAQGTFQWLGRYIKGLYHKPNVIDPRDLQYITALYDGEIRYTDTHVGRLLEKIEMMVGLDNCLVVLTSDHGEEFNDHGSMEGHQWTLYDEIIHVPLIFQFPNRQYAAMVMDKPAGLIDIAPTILDWLGIVAPKGFQGHSLMESIKNRKKNTTERMLFAETRRHTIKQSIRTQRYKLIHTDDIGISKHGLPVVAGYEMYDMINDPLEKKNIYDASLPVAKLLADKLQSWRTSQLKTIARKEKQPEVHLSPQEIELLRSLGYVD